MSEQWEMVHDVPYNRVRRMAVPGGWLYQVEVYLEMDFKYVDDDAGPISTTQVGWSAVQFVPEPIADAPIRLGELPSASEDMRAIMGEMLHLARLEHGQQTEALESHLSACPRCASESRFIARQGCNHFWHLGG